jgi:hypothetical protein
LTCNCWKKCGQSNVGWLCWRTGKGGELQRQVLKGSEGPGELNQIEAVQRLRTLAAPVVETRDVAALLQVATSNATTVLRRLAQRGMIADLSCGRWLVNEKIDRLALPD